MGRIWAGPDLILIFDIYFYSNSNFDFKILSEFWEDPGKDLGHQTPDRRGGSRKIRGLPDFAVRLL